MVRDGVESRLRVYTFHGRLDEIEQYRLTVSIYSVFVERLLVGAEGRDISVCLSHLISCLQSLEKSR